jgi:RNA polymerase sigma factor (sigma-70 family)
LNEPAFIRALQAGDPQAFKTLVDTWQHMVYNTVLGIVQQAEEAEDIAQEVFIQVYRSVQSFRGEAKLSTWLYRIAVTKALDAERRKKTARRFGQVRAWFSTEEKEEVPADFAHPGVDLENKEKAAALFKAMRALPDNQRIAFLLIKTEGLSYDETAAVMNTSVKAVEALMHRAKENLRKKLQQYYQP